MPITASAGRLRGKSHGILPKEFAQLRVQLRVRGPQRAWPLEERFRRNCEELSRIGCAVSVGRIGCAAPSRIPRQYKRAQTTARVAEAVFRPFLPDSSADVPHFIGGIASRVNEDRRQLGVVVGLSMKE